MKDKNLFLIHGGPGFDDSYFFPYLDALGEQYNEVISYNIGESVSKYTLAALVSELRSKLIEITKPLTIIGHSFGAALAIEALHNDLELQKNKTLIFSNWVYDNKWIDLFYTNFPDAANEQVKSSLKEATLSYTKYYFNNMALGESVLKKINYRDEIFKSQTSYLQTMDISQKIASIKAPIVSISSMDDCITPPAYIKKIEKRFKIPGYIISNAGHFPFIEQPTVFRNIIQTIEEETR